MQEYASKSRVPTGSTCGRTVRLPKLVDPSHRPLTAVNCPLQRCLALPNPVPAGPLLPVRVKFHRRHHQIRRTIGGSRAPFHACQVLEEFESHSLAALPLVRTSLPLPCLGSFGFVRFAPLSFPHLSLCKFFWGRSEPHANGCYSLRFLIPLLLHD